MKMSHRIMQLSLLGVALAAAPAYGQRICILDFPGPGGAAVRKQLATQLCDTSDCVAPPQVSTRGKPDLKKAKREMVQYFVSGTLKKGKVDLSVLTVARNDAVAAKKTFSLERGQLSPKTLRAAVELVRGAISEPAAPAREPNPPTEMPPPEPVQAALPPPSADTEPASPPVAAEPTPVAPPESSGRKAPGFALELGSSMLHRSFGYDNASSGNLRGYDLSLYPLPFLHAELYPFALLGIDSLSGLGLEGTFGYAPFLKSKTASGTDSYPTSAMKADFGVNWRLLPFGSFPLVITPAAGLRIQSFLLAADSTGQLLDGLPNLQFVGVRLGVGLELPVAQDSVILLARFSVMPLLAASELISATYFPSGSGLGVEGSAGIAVQLASFVQIRATFEYTQYSLSFQTTSSATYVATGAADRYLGGNLALRLQF